MVSSDQFGIPEQRVAPALPWLGCVRCTLVREIVADAVKGRPSEDAVALMGKILDVLTEHDHEPATFDDEPKRGRIVVEVTDAATAAAGAVHMTALAELTGHKRTEETERQIARRMLDAAAPLMGVAFKEV